MHGDKNDRDGSPRRQQQYKRDELLGLHLQMASLRQENLQLKDQMSWESTRSDQQFANMTRMMRRLLVQAARPIRNVRTGEVTAGNQEYCATCCGHSLSVATNNPYFVDRV